MPHLPNRLAIASFQSWEAALRVKAELTRSGLSQEGMLFLALADVFSTSGGTSPDDPAELPLLEPGGPVCCIVGPLAAKLRLRENESKSLKGVLSRWLLPRQTERIASYVKDGKIVMAVRLAKGEDGQAACRTLLAHTSAPLEVHDIDCGDCRARR
jgi:hypothetical protein